MNSTNRHLLLELPVGENTYSGWKDFCRIHSAVGRPKCMLYLIVNSGLRSMKGDSIPSWQRTELVPVGVYTWVMRTKCHIKKANCSSHICDALEHHITGCSNWIHERDTQILNDVLFWARKCITTSFLAESDYSSMADTIPVTTQNPFNEKEFLKKK